MKIKAPLVCTKRILNFIYIYIYILETVKILLLDKYC